MSFAKSHLFPFQDQVTGTYARALSHPARLVILKFLHDQGPSTVEELCTVCPLSQPTVSQHLEILRKADLIRYKERHPYVFYSLHSKELLLAEAYVLEFFEALRPLTADVRERDKEIFEDEREG